MGNVTNIRNIAEFFLLSVAWTLTLFSPIASSRLTGNGLIKLLSNVSIGALTLASVITILSNTPLSHYSSYLKIMAYVALLATSIFHREEKTLFMWLLYGVIVLSLGTHIVLFSPLVHGSIFLLSSSLLLGIILYSMILGHWYLVVPKLSERPLKIAALILWTILIPKIIFSVLSVSRHLDFFEQQTTLGDGYSFNWMLLTMRISFGYVVISALSFLNWKLVSMRSIQSSTGILYAMTIFVFIGELSSVYIFFNFGLYI